MLCRVYDPNLPRENCFSDLNHKVSPESLKPSVLPRIKIWASQTFLTLAYCGRQYFDQFEENLINKTSGAKNCRY